MTSKYKKIPPKRKIFSYKYSRNALLQDTSAVVHNEADYNVGNSMRKVVPIPSSEDFT